MAGATIEEPPENQPKVREVEQVPQRLREGLLRCVDGAHHGLFKDALNLRPRERGVLCEDSLVGVTNLFNHSLAWQAGAGQIPAPPAVRTTGPAVKTFAASIMSLSVLGYAAWALLQSVLATFGSRASMMPWWVVTDLMEWSKWFVLGVLVWLSAPMLALGATVAAGSDEGATATYRELIGFAGFAVFAFPVLSVAATVVVTAIKVSLVHSWATEGTVFWAPYYYRNVLRTYLPCFVVGVGMIGLRRLMGVRS